MSETKSFHISDILSITTGRLVSHDHVGGVYNILGWMTGETLFTHQLPRASDMCKPVLETVFPDLARIEFPAALGNNEVAIFDWIDELAEAHGQWFDVPKLSEEYLAKYGPRPDPLTELIDTLGEDRVVLVLTDPVGREM